MDIDRSLEPTHVVDFKSHINCVEFSPFEWSNNLICVAVNDEISVGLVKFQEENEGQEEELEFHLLREFRQGCRIETLAWSPETSLGVLPKVVKFAAARSDFDIHVIYSDLVDRDTVHVLTGHKSYVNTIAFDPNSTLLASGSDDHTVRLWEDDTCVKKILVQAPVVSVCWHRSEPGSLLVATLDGAVRQVAAATGRVLATLTTFESPLTDVHWAPSNANVVAATAGTNLVMWDIKRPSLNENLRVLYGECAARVRVCPTNHQVVATLGEPRHELKVTHLQAKAPLLATTCTIYGGLSWHHKLSYVCVGIDRKLCLWKVGTK